MRAAMSKRLRRALSGSKTGSSWLKYFDYTTADLKRHIERQFSRGMTWENHGAVWHVDHIVPVASFDLTDIGEVKRCFALTNLRPLWAEANRRKQARRTHLI